ncbi:MAG: virulence factor [Actinomycetota bacterium]
MSARGRRSRRGGPGLTTIYWRDIPAQITVTTDDGESAKVLLEPRFQHAIDRAAHVAGLTDTNDYVQQWRRVAGPVEGDPAEAAQTAADAIHSDYPRDRLEALVAAGGLEPDGGQDQ